jgi:hypothetical protein
MTKLLPYRVFKEKFVGKKTSKEKNTWKTA